jgi:hypothetical protein
MVAAPDGGPLILHDRPPSAPPPEHGIRLQPEHGIRLHRHCRIVLRRQERPVDQPSFGSLLYRYWFYGWMFRDVHRGNRIERAAAWRHNQAAGRWLPVYLRRWTLLGLGTFAIGWAIESLEPLSGTAHSGWPIETLFFVPCVVSVSVNAVTLAAWIGLKVLPAP